MAPRLVPRDEVGDPQTLRIRCRLNGETVQDASTADMVFGVAEIVSLISETITLEPGVAMRSPEGRYLEAGDTVEVEIERVGVLSNPVRAET